MENVTLVAKKDASQQTMIVRKRKRMNEPSLQTKVVTAGLAACMADLLTFPLDTAKVRLQIQGETGSSTVQKRSGGNLAQAAKKQLKYKGVVGTLCTIAKEEGPRACYNGLVPGLQRQMCFASIRIGLYDSVKKTYMAKLGANGTGGQNVGVRILAGITTGGMAVICAQPTDVVKVRMQAQSGRGPKRYPTCLGAFRTIAKQEGVRGLWKGTSPNIARNAIVNASELVSYDLIKEFILRKQFLTDNMPCHMVSAFGAGFCTTVIASPVDVVKTRFMNSPNGAYSGVLGCANSMFKAEGLKAFYKGFVPSFVRLGSWNIVMFVCYEQLKKGVTNFNKNVGGIEVENQSSRFM